MADTAKDFDTLGEKPDVEHWPGQLNVSKMSGTGGHVARTRLALRGPIHHPLSGVHEPTKFRATPFHRVRVADTVGERHGHSFLIGEVGKERAI